MDPIANLNEQRELAAFILSPGKLTTYEWQHNAKRLAELVEALDAWRKRGGFDPYQREANPDCAACGATVYQRVCVKCGEQAKP